MGKWLIWIAAGVVVLIALIGGTAVMKEAKGDDMVAQQVSPIEDGAS